MRKLLTIGLLLFVNLLSPITGFLKEEQGTFEGFRYISPEEILSTYKNKFAELNDSLFESHGRIIKNKNGFLYIQHQFAYSSYLHSNGFSDKALVILNRIQNEGEWRTHPNSVVNYYNIRGLILHETGRLKDAKELYEKAILVSVTTKDSLTLKKLYINLGDVLYRQSKLDSAHHYFQLALELEQSGVTDYHTQLQNSLGVVYLSMGKTAKSVEIYEGLIEESTSPVPVLYLNLGKSYYIAEDYHKSIEALQQGLVLEKNGSANEELLNIFYDDIGQAYHAIGNVDLAYNYLDKADSIADLHIESKMNLEIEELRLKHQKRLHYVETIMNQEKIMKERSIKNLLVIFSSVVMGLLTLVFIFYYRQRQQNKHLLRKNIEITQIKKKKKSNKNIKNDLVTKIAFELIEKEVFLESDLTLDSLSKKVNANRSYVSEAINQHYSMNFRSLVNKLRVEKAQELLLSKAFSHYSIEGISNTVGFKSLSSFNTAFKKETGLTPSFYRKKA